MVEPHSTALLLVTLGLLLGASVLFSRAVSRVGIPVALIFIGVGIVAGAEGLGGIHFEDYAVTYRLGTVALVLILFDGGLNTPLQAVREGFRPALVLATVGVAITAGLVALAALSIKLSLGEALLLGAVVSSTDAAAVFAVLRGSGLHLKRRVGVTLELESGLNDPMAVILTVSATRALITGEPLGLKLLWDIALQLGVGLAAGLAVGYGGRLLLSRIRLSAAGLYPVISVAIALTAFGFPTLVEGSGFLAVYVAALLIGNGSIRYRHGLLRVHDALAWLAQTAMFLMLGLLVLPSRLMGVAWEGLGLGLFLALVARPFAVVLCLLPFRFRWLERAYVGWVGLRGAVPVILATYPVLAGAPGAHWLFDVVFFIVVVNALVPGMVVPKLTKQLGLLGTSPPPPQAMLEIHSTHPLNGELISFFVSDASAVNGASIAELPFPPTSSVTLIVRGEELLAPKGGTTLEPGDHVYVFGRLTDLPLLRLLFGQQAED